MSEEDKSNLTIRRFDGNAWQIFASENLLERLVKVNANGFAVKMEVFSSIAIIGGDELGRLLLASAATMGDMFFEDVPDTKKFFTNHHMSGAGAYPKWKKTFKARFCVNPSNGELRITFHSAYMVRGDGNENILMSMVQEAFDKMKELGRDELRDFTAIDDDAKPPKMTQLAGPGLPPSMPVASSASIRSPEMSLNLIVKGLSKLQSNDAPKPSQKTICEDALRKIRGGKLVRKTLSLSML